MPIYILINLRYDIYYYICFDQYVSLFICVHKLTILTNFPITFLLIKHNSLNFLALFFFPTKYTCRIGRGVRVRVGRGCLVVSHLLFANDSLFCCKTSAGEARQMKDMLATYEKASGQLINYEKSTVFLVLALAGTKGRKYAQN